MVARPFFMTLPGYPGRMDEKEILNDLEYLQQTYPGEVRRCQRRIAERHHIAHDFSAAVPQSHTVHTGAALQPLPDR